MKSNYQYIEIGQLHQSKKGLALSLKLDGKKRHETFEDADTALEHLVDKVKEIHKSSKAPVSVKYIREDGTLTWLCYEADSKPKEFAAFDYLGFNTSSHKDYERRVYMTPRHITYNDIARTSAAEKVRDRRVKNIVDSLLFIFWTVLLALVLKYSFVPSDDVKAASNQFGLEYDNPLAWATIIGGFACVIAYLIADNVPRIIFWRKSLEGIEGINAKIKSYGESKDWRRFYRSRHYGNIWSIIFLGAAFVLLVIAAIGLNSSVYFEFRLGLASTTPLVAMLVIAVVLLSLEATLKVFGFIQSHERRALVLHKYVDEELKPYFKAWTMHKGIKNEDLKFHWDVFVYPQSKEDQNKSYEAIKQNSQLTASENRKIKNELELELKKAFSKKTK